MNDHNPKLSEELAECVQGLRTLLERRVRVLEMLIAVLVEHPSIEHYRQEKTVIPKSVRAALPLLLQAVGSSSNTVIRLSDKPGFQTRDCYAIARSIVELAINICYVIAQGEPIAEKAIRHSRQKAYQDLDRESTIGNSVLRATFEGKPDIDGIPGMKEEIAEFTSKTGREKGWVDENVDDRIAAAGKELGSDVLTKLHIARFMVYRHSSEILHGTVFSAFFFFGLTQPKKPKTAHDLVENFGHQHMLILVCLGLATDAIVAGFHKKYGFSWAQKENAKITEALKEISFLKQPEQEADA